MSLLKLRHDVSLQIISHIQFIVDKFYDANAYFSFLLEHINIHNKLPM